MDQICISDDAELCKSTLAVVSVVYRPTTLEELASFVDIPNGVSSDYEALAEIIGLCGSFLKLRERTISFAHQSAKDYLVEHASAKIFPDGRTAFPGRRARLDHYEAGYGSRLGCLHTNALRTVWSVAFSHDGTQVVSAAQGL
jgi:hypothetical protein